MDYVYPTGPDSIPENLTQPTSVYRTRAWMAMAGLALFVALYFALSIWFSWTAWRLLGGFLKGGEDSLWGGVIGLCSAFLAVFMWKALFFVKHRYEIDDIEITRDEQPRLFAFLERLADEAGAPRPHRVYLSPRVNAAVFYDLSILNLIFPSKKNLEIGLGLVNMLTLGEMKAVLAHEFGHFAQRSMAVGRWVYIAQQIAGHVIAKRDILDRFLRGLSRFDIRIAWVGWILSLVVWSIRSVMETVFRIVVLAQRALSREMEFQADLVAVSLTGSDALVHALHRLHIGDEAWSRTLAFAETEAQAGRSVTDLFEVQTRIATKLRAILDDPSYRDVSPPPPERPEAHRIFKTELASPPRMWSTHPANSEREDNAKRTYIPAPIDGRSAWELFDNAQPLREKMSAHVFRTAKTEPATLDDSLRKLDEQFDRAYLNPRYRGTYLGRAITLHARATAELYAALPASDALASELEMLYPESLSGEMERLRELEGEKAALEALRDGFMTAPGGIIRHRGRELRRSELPETVAAVEGEIRTVCALVHAHDCRCRSAHLAAAQAFGAGWADYLTGLVRIVHYAEHAEANLRDAHGAFANVFAIVTADGRVSKSEMKRLVRAAEECYSALHQIHVDGSEVVLDRTLVRRLAVENWAASLGKFELPAPNDDNLPQWLNVIDSWVAAAASALSALRLAALDQLLLTEAQVAKFVRDRMTPAAAAEPSRVPEKFVLLPPGTERERQKKLGLWDRFQVADGALATVARLAVAAGIVIVALSFGGAIGEATVSIFNGLGRPVLVSVGDTAVRVGALTSARVSMEPADHQTVRATTADGKLIEEFQADLDSAYGHYVYNVASASALVQWTAVYGPRRPGADHKYGAPRWMATSAAYVFEDPPEKLQADKSGTSRDVLTAIGGSAPAEAIALVEEPAELASLIKAHALWDQSSMVNAAHWLQLASTQPDFQSILAERLRENPHDVLTLRIEQDNATEDQMRGICDRHRALAAAAPNDGDLQYIGTRCIEDSAARDAAFLEAHRSFPANAWLALAAGYVFADRAQWQDAVAPLEMARKGVRPYADMLATDQARIRRIVASSAEVELGDLFADASNLRVYQTLEKGNIDPTHPNVAYYHLSRGNLQSAVQTAGKDEDRLVRLAGASDGASRELIGRALAMPLDRGIDQDTAWSALALAMREHTDTAPYDPIIRQMARPEDAEAILRFAAAVQAGQDLEGAERQLNGVYLQYRGQAYSMAVVLLRDRTPRNWRDGARLLLFSPERPYFAEN